MTATTSTSTSYLITFTATDKHPGLKDRCQHMGDGIYVAAVRITEGFTTLDQKTVTRILTVTHGQRYDNIIPVAAYSGDAEYLDESSLVTVFA